MLDPILVGWCPGDSALQLTCYCYGITQVLYLETLSYLWDTHHKNSSPSQQCEHFISLLAETAVFSEQLGACQVLHECFPFIIPHHLQTLKQQDVHFYYSVLTDNQAEVERN